MDIKSLYDSIKSAIPDLKIYQNHPLAPYTTIRIGGPADLFVIVEKDYQLRALVKLIYQKDIELTEKGGNIVFGTESSKSDFTSDEGREYQKKLLPTDIPITILGNGSNIIISDSGIRGLVIKIATQEIAIHPELSQGIQPSTSISTQRSEGDSQKYLDFSKLDYDETNLPQKKVTLSCGLSLARVITKLLDQGLTGLQWFAYIPASIGGAVYGNIHGGSHNFSEVIDSVEIFDFTTGQFKKIKSQYLDWRYDHSTFQFHPEWLIISVTLKLFVGDTQKARQVVDAWIKQKQKVQAMNSAGSVFKNPSLEDCQRLWGEQKSSGWIIDQVLGLKGVREGDIQVSTNHANFIINHGHGTAADYLKLVKTIQSAAQEKLHLNLKPEVKFIS